MIGEVASHCCSWFKPQTLICLGPKRGRHNHWHTRLGGGRGQELKGVPKAGLAPQAGLQEACLNREEHPSKRPPRGLPKLGGDEMMKAWAKLRPGLGKLKGN